MSPSRQKKDLKVKHTPGQPEQKGKPEARSPSAETPNEEATNPRKRKAQNTDVEGSSVKNKQALRPRRQPDPPRGNAQSHLDTIQTVDSDKLPNPDDNTSSDDSEDEAEHDPKAPFSSLNDEYEYCNHLVPKPLNPEPLIAPSISDDDIQSLQSDCMTLESKADLSTTEEKLLRQCRSLLALAKNQKDHRAFLDAITEATSDLERRVEIRFPAKARKARLSGEEGQGRVTEAADED